MEQGECKCCGHTKDWHQKGDLVWSMIFGFKYGGCTHYTVDYSKPFWKRKRNYCKCECYKDE